MCAKDGESKDVATKIRADAEILIFPNINLSGRKRVEAGTTRPLCLWQSSRCPHLILDALVTGEYCLRSNQHGVDLNRNWDAHWTDDHQNAAAIDSQSFGGSRPFSELETQILKSAANEFKVSGARARVCCVSDIEIRISGSHNH